MIVASLRRGAAGRVPVVHVPVERVAVFSSKGEDSAGAFRGVDACLCEAGSVGSGQSAVGTVIVGCDIAKHTDWTVLIAMDAKTGLCLEMERFNQLDWPVQRERITAFVKRWNGRLVMDATGVGDPVFDDLRRVLPRVEGFKITAQSKRELVQGHMVAVEQRRVTWPMGKLAVGSGSGQCAVGTGINHEGTKGLLPSADRLLPTGDWEVLTAEMRRYEYEIGPTGQVSYAAPSGYHDDCVMALALAVWGCRAFGVEPGRMMRLCEGLRSEVRGRWTVTLA